MAQVNPHSLDILPIPVPGSGQAAPANPASGNNLFFNQLVSSLSQIQSEAISSLPGQLPAALVTGEAALIPELQLGEGGKPLPLNGQSLPLPAERTQLDVEQLLAQHLAEPRPAAALSAEAAEIAATVVETAVATDAELPVVPTAAPVTQALIDESPLDPRQTGALVAPAHAAVQADSHHGRAVSALATELHPGTLEKPVEQGSAAARGMQIAELAGSNARAEARAATPQQPQLTPEDMNLSVARPESLAQQAAPAQPSTLSVLASRGIGQQSETALELRNNIAAGGDTQALESRLASLTSTAVTATSQSASTVAREPQLLLPNNALNDPGWAQAMGQRVSWMVQQGVQTASIQLMPEELGQIQVRVSVVGEMANVEFHARHATTSDLIESMLPRLNAALDAQGLRVEELKVSQQPVLDNGQAQTSQQQSESEGKTAGRPGSDSSSPTGLDPGASPPDSGEERSLSLLDAYA